MISFEISPIMTGACTRPTSLLQKASTMERDIEPWSWTKLRAWQSCYTPSYWNMMSSLETMSRIILKSPIAHFLVKT